MNEQQEFSRVSGIKVVLAVVPALLVISICVALYLGAHADKEKSKPNEGEVTVAEMSGYLEKLNEVIGERRLNDEEGQTAFRQLRAMIMGALGPQNLGYQVSQTQLDNANGLLWPTIWVTAGLPDAREVVVVAIPQGGSGTPVAFGFGLAEYLAGLATEAGVRIVYFPPLVEGEFHDWIWARCGREGETMKGLIRVMGGDPKDRVTVLAGPEGEPFLTELKESKWWDDGLALASETLPVLEVRLVEQGRSSRGEHAARLIQLMPFMKNIVDRLGR